MNTIARLILIKLVARFGRSILDDRRKCEALLLDVYGDDNKRELFVVLIALKNHIPSELLSGSSGATQDVLIGRLAGQLHQNCGLDKELAYWGVESWGIALGVMDEQSSGSESRRPQVNPQPTEMGIDGHVPLTREVDHTFPRVKPQPQVHPQPPSTSNKSMSLWRVGVIGVLVTALLLGISTCRNSGERMVGGMLTNTLGMVFTRVPGGPMFSIWDVRVMDYGVYVAANSGADTSWKDPGFVQGPDHPVVNVSWDDAQAFCTWLTKKEQGEGRIKADQSYRLPTDAEWSVAVGLEGEVGSTPREKEGKIKGVYPWGRQWPPPKGAGNYDPALGADDYDYTSPVGSLQRNGHGLYDMGGNVWQWCEDRYEGEQISRVLRGASWVGINPDILLSSYRGFNYPDCRIINVGFRCVLVGGGSL